MWVFFASDPREYNYFQRTLKIFQKNALKSNKSEFE